MPLAWLTCEQNDLPAEKTWLADVERRYAGELRYPKRRAEFLLRRWTAKQALAATLGLEADLATLARLEARAAPDGAPEPHFDGAPLSVTLSLSDRAGRGLCVVDTDGAAVGCDIELVERRSNVFVQDWFTAAERDVVLAAGDERDLLANLVWSAKESALKVLRTGLRRDTRSVEVRLGDVYDATAWVGLSVCVDDGRVFPGWWRRHGSFVITVVSEDTRPTPLHVARARFSTTS